MIEMIEFALTLWVVYGLWYLLTVFQARDIIMLYNELKRLTSYLTQ